MITNLICIGIGIAIGLLFPTDVYRMINAIRARTGR